MRVLFQCGGQHGAPGAAARSGNSVNCMCWASLAALAFDAEERVELQKGNNENIATYDESIATYAFRAACTVSRCLSRNVSGGIPRSYPEWKAILFPRDGADIFPTGGWKI